MLNGTASVVRSTVLTDMLNAPVSELTMSKHIDLS